MTLREAITPIVRKWLVTRAVIALVGALVFFGLGAFAGFRYARSSMWEFTLPATVDVQQAEGLATPDADGKMRAVILQERGKDIAFIYFRGKNRSSVYLLEDGAYRFRSNVPLDFRSPEARRMNGTKMRKELGL